MKIHAKTALLALILGMSSCITYATSDSATDDELIETVKGALERVLGDPDAQGTARDPHALPADPPAVHPVSPADMACPPRVDKLSQLAWHALNESMASNVLKNSTVPGGLLLTACNQFDKVLVDGPAIFAGFGDEIALAKHEVDIVFMKWEPNSDAAAEIGRGLARALASREASDKLLVRMLIDEVWFTGSPIDNLYESVKAWNLDPDRVEIQLGTYPHLTTGALHDKFVVIDSKTLLLTGANVETHHDKYDHDSPLPWHDIGYVLRGSVALSALASFDQAWGGQAKHWECHRVNNCRSTDPPEACFQSHDCGDTLHPEADRYWFGSIERAQGNAQMIAVGRDSVGGFSNHTDNPQDQAWLAVMNNAARDIIVVSPNINDNEFQEAVLRAAKRGVRVWVLTSVDFNKADEDLPGQGGNNCVIFEKLRQRMLELPEAQRGNLELCWYAAEGASGPVVGNGPGANHTKVMLVDGEIAIVGSGNMDTQSWDHSRELNVLVDDPAAVQLIKAEFLDTDLRNAVCAQVEQCVPPGRELPDSANPEQGEQAGRGSPGSASPEQGDQAGGGSVDSANPEQGDPAGRSSPDSASPEEGDQTGRGSPDSTGGEQNGEGRRR